MKHLRLILPIAFPLLLLGLFFTTLQTKASPAATFVVNSTVDAVDANPGDGVCETAVAGQCTLRAAVMEANASSGLDTINLSANTYNLTILGAEEDLGETGDLDITDDLFLNGDSAVTTILNGSGNDRVFHITSTGSIHVSISNLTIQNGVFDESSNVAEPNGGGIYIPHQGATVFITDTVFLNNRAFGSSLSGSGGAIYNSGSLQISSTEVFTNGSPGGHGLFNSGDLSVKNSTFGFNSIEFAGPGGTIYNTGKLTVNGTSFHNNYSYAGGGVHNSPTGIATLDDVNIFSNTVYLNGGGVFNFGTITVTNSTIHHNDNTTSPGGGISNFGVFILNNSMVHHNAAEGFALGGGIAISDGVFEINNSTVYSNSAGIGGGIYLEDGELLLNSSIISGNVADTTGGGIYTLKPVSVENSNISDNVAAEGGGIFVDGTAFTITNSTIENNQANSAAGIGLYNTAQASMHNSTVSYNSAITEGGGLFVDSTSTAVLATSTFSHNSATTGGGIYNNGLLNATNTTVSHNAASSEGGGIWHGGLGTNEVTFTNVTLAENSSPNGSGIYQANFAAITITNTIIASNGVENCNLALTASSYSLEDKNDCGFVGIGDQIDIDPMLGPLQNNGGVTDTFAPLENSPAIDAGSNANCLATDQRGISRPIDGDGDGTAVCDIGAVEVEIVTETMQYLYLPIIVKP
ncbi:MAG: CSLREA domain-containing protein [Anaerolineaceae bacterium]|nr:CSLREA domain-containing protein [Anaerolineaceae bacterium]